MKSTGAIIFAMALVTAITMKAFFASKLALLVTIGMAMKKLYESYSNGIGLPNNPYLYSQYPIDFPSASSQGYSVNGVNTQFASPDMYNPTAVGSQSHSHEIIHQNEVTAQQSQQAPTLLLNSTRSASERWDGKSKLLKFLEPILGSVRNVFEPLANVFYSMPATFRGLNSDVTTASSETNVDENNIKEFLIPQPRHIAQRKMNYRMAPRTKKYTELKVNLERLRQNKDLPDYLKTKKYKFNYPSTYYYPRVKYFVNPNIFITKPNNSRLSQYRKETMRKNETVEEKNNDFITETSDWKPIIMPQITNVTLKANDTNNKVKKSKKKHTRRKNKRTKRDVNNNIVPTFYDQSDLGNDKKIIAFGRGFISIFGSGLFEFLIDPMSVIFKHAGEITKDLIESSTKKKKPPHYYSIAYNMVMHSLDTIAGMFDITNVLTEQYLGDLTKKKNKGYRGRPMFYGTSRATSESYSAYQKSRR
ncbi:hypothetical protein RR46_00551 [Papilio xuthus]|uniref:Uncharacterized protein n=1 Tax=Papilio xuthus TaxID=66420 RepID=A0A0N1IMW4_PAPXU|nr:hypothetical protein RR46_00551 [Papilio xuthus]